MVDLFIKSPGKAFKSIHIYDLRSEITQYATAHKMVHIEYPAEIDVFFFFRLVSVQALTSQISNNRTFPPSGSCLLARAFAFSLGHS
jgi:hypothetical protein